MTRATSSSVSGSARTADHCFRAFPPTSEGRWEQCHTHGKARIALSLYLQELLRRLDIEDVPVYGSLDGQRLAPYQAAVRNGAWKRAWERVEQPYKAQRAAYRRYFGGSAAPELKMGLDPRFVQADMDSGSDEASTGGASSERGFGQNCSDDADGAGRDLPVRGTFVHIDRRPQPQLRRCGSLPPSKAESSEVMAC